MKYRSPIEIIHHLTRAGTPLETAEKIAKASRKHHCDASESVIKEKGNIGEITETQQLRLFELTYKIYVRDSI